MITALYGDRLIGGFVEAADRGRIVELQSCA
ncbi:hypothetical protein GGE46_004164 [Rhizobium etli]|uniref:Uncharacterized protein n=1 Tax=Rhizobium etli TaxID=29449 RepID=A0A7W6VCB5_RHIET|nr:hypothetical protein [Rhizobium etli]MBB4537395.1 hypothetical protein [Rhizobium etli]